MLRMEGKEIAPAAPLRERNVIAPHEAVGPSYYGNRTLVLFAYLAPRFFFAFFVATDTHITKTLQFHPV
jgi:hypothetical protein